MVGPVKRPQVKKSAGDELGASTARVAESYREEQQGIAAQVRSIHEEGQNLQQAAKTLGRRQEVAVQVDRLNFPTAPVKRWFSESARRELTEAQATLRALDHAAKALGTTTEGESQARRRSWQEDRARLPGLQVKAAGLGQLLELTARALDGFAQEQEREHDWLIRSRPKRAHDRDANDSGRDR